jgi:hypothetical protein
MSQTPNRKYIAIWDERWNEYRWFSVANAQRNFEENRGKPLPDGCVETTYKATGRFVTRDDGEQAQIFE